MASCLRPITIKAFERQQSKFSPGSLVTGRVKYISVPCGHCPNCLMKRQHDWAIRMEKETDFITRNGGSCYFITLTYDDENLTYGETDQPSLSKMDAKRFLESFKRRMIYYKDCKIRYFLCGEYGDHFSRPHFHVNIWFPRLDITSEELRPHVEACWQNGLVLGIHPYSSKLAEYIAKYSTKQLGDLYEGIQAPFALMSLKPAIGKCWIDENRDFYITNPHYYLTNRLGTRYSLPRYYRNRVSGINEYYSFVSQIIAENDLKLQNKLEFNSFTNVFRDEDNAHERFIENFWTRVKNSRSIF